MATTARFIKRTLNFGLWFLIFGALFSASSSSRAQDASALLSAPKLPPYKWFASTDPKRQNADYVLLKPGETRRIPLADGVLLRLWSTAFEPQNLRLVLQNGNQQTELLNGGKAKFGELYEKAFTFYPTRSTPAAVRELKSNAVLIATNKSKAENKWYYQASVGAKGQSFFQSSGRGRRGEVNEGRLDWSKLDASLKEPTSSAKKLLEKLNTDSKWDLRIAYGSARSQKGQPIPILKVQGEGAFVGLVLDIRPAPDAFRRTFAFLEGNETLIADGKKYEGTGAEDFFNSAWYYPEKPFEKQYHGMSFKSTSPPRVTAYRWMISDAVPFQKNFEFNFEHGNGSKSDDLEFRWVAFWYQKHNAKFDIADALSKAQSGGASGQGSTPAAAANAAFSNNEKLLVLAVLGAAVGVGALLLIRRKR